MSEYKLQIAGILLRVFTSILFLFQGYDKIFKVKINGVINTFLGEAEHHHIHKPMVTIIAYYTSFVEFFGGIFLLLGLFTDYTLLFLGTDLVFVCLAFSVMEPVWDLRHVFPRLLLIVILLLLPTGGNMLSLDYLLKIN